MIADTPNSGKRPVPMVISTKGDWRNDPLNDIFFAAVETTRMPMVVTNPHLPDNPIVFVNRAFVQMTGYDTHEIVGRNCRFLQGAETDRSAVEKIGVAVKSGREIAIEILNYKKDGTTFWNALFIAPVYDTDLNIAYYFASQLDVSRRRDAEDALYQAQKMEALGQLTGGIAHDFNNLLQVMTGYLDIIDNHADQQAMDPEKVSRSVNSIRSAVNKAAMLTQQLLAFARKQRLEGRTVNLNLLTNNFADLVRRTLGGNIELQTALAPALWNCKVDPTQVEVALLNILLNARDAMQQGGVLTLRTQNEVIGPEELKTLEGVLEGRYVSIALVDTGVGMPASILQRVMDPFFTTKEEGKGTGLGLSMVYGFAKQSGGAVHVESSVGHGTTVKIYFPATDEIEPIAVDSSQRIVTGTEKETILVVDDRIEVAELAQAMLESFGYKVLVTTLAKDALDILGMDNTITMLFSDVIMPGDMNGIALARECRKRRPDLRVLLTTGYAEACADNGSSNAEFDIINKPYRRAELSRKVRIVLDGSNGIT